MLCRCFVPSVAPRGGGAVGWGQGTRRMRDGVSYTLAVPPVLAHATSFLPRERVHRAGPRLRCLILEARDVFCASTIRITPYLIVAMRVVTAFGHQPEPRGTCHTSSTCFLGERDNFTVCCLRWIRIVPRSSVLESHGMNDYVWDGRRGLLHSRSNAGARKEQVEYQDSYVKCSAGIKRGKMQSMRGVRERSMHGQLEGGLGRGRNTETSWSESSRHYNPHCRRK